jgi:predicted DNA-binding antitoxin AbrB/MazE fold protein
MGTTLIAIYDGQVLRPEGPVDLKPNTRYQVIIEREVHLIKGRDAWEVLEQVVGAVQAPEDWATEHDHYLYGTPKRAQNPVT